MPFLFFTSIFKILLILIVFLIQKNIKSKKSRKQLLSKLKVLKSNSPTWYLNTSDVKTADSPYFDKGKIEQFINAKLNPTDLKILNILYENPSLTAKEMGSEISLSTQGRYSSLKKMYSLFDLHKSNENQRLAVIVKALRISGYQSSN